MTLFLKELLGAVAILLTFLAFVPYILSVMRGKTKPHMFSWIIWGVTTFIVFLAQMADGGGAGAWSIGVSALLTFHIAWLAYRKKSDITITRSDWFFFLSSLAAVPFWYVTSDPLWAVVLLTAIDTVAFLPTIRKAYHKPFEEQMFLYVVMAIRNLVSMVALENYSLTTLLFPAVLTLACVIFIPMVIVRRRQWKG